MAVLLTASSSAHPNGADRHAELQRACSQQYPIRPPSVTVVRHRMEGDLPYFEARNTKIDATIKVFYESGLEQAATRAASCLATVLWDLPRFIPDPTRGIQWEAVVLTHDAGYKWDRATQAARWVLTLPDGKWTDRAEEYILITMPHEQVHVRQLARHSAKLPRWFEEGHAQWAGLHVSELVRPDLALEERRRKTDAWARFGNVHLRSWGSVRVKREAILRQLSPEDRAHGERDPSFNPPGPFHFGPGDFELVSGQNGKQDETGIYAAALAVFDQLEARHGRAAVQRWTAAVLESNDSAQIVPLAQSVLGEDIAPLLN
nr:hypothetical protein [uncultured Sphingomonas sp.]